VSTVSDGMQAGLFQGRKDVLHQPTGQSVTECGLLLAENVDSPSRLLIETAKFAPRVMVSAGVCLQVKGHLHFVQEKSVNVDYYVNELLSKLMDDCHHLLGQHFIFQQDGAPAHAAKSTQQWLAAYCPDFFDKKAWPPNSSDLNPLDYLVWGWMLDKFSRLNPQPKNIPELKTVLLMIWDKLPQEAIRKSIVNFCKCLRAKALASMQKADTLNINCKIV